MIKKMQEFKKIIFKKRVGNFIRFFIIYDNKYFLSKNEFY